MSNKDKDMKEEKNHKKERNHKKVSGEPRKPLTDWRVFYDEFSETPGGKMLGILAIAVFMIPIFVSQFMGLKKMEAFAVELGGWAIEAAIFAVIYLILWAVKRKK